MRGDHGAPRDAWDLPQTVAAWQRFDALSDRYRVVNRALAEHAALPEDAVILDVGAGTGGTAVACLPHLGPRGRVLCVEPSQAMAAAGQAALAHEAERVSWTPSLPADEPGGHGSFDRILCGASLWLLGPPAETLARLARLLRPGGALVFAMPAAYLGEVDPPGGGPDPWLTELPQALVQGRTRAPEAGPGLPDADGLLEAIRSTGLRPEAWTVQTRWTLESQAAWFRLPPVGLAMRPDLDPEALPAAVDAALATCRPGSWRPEGWMGVTAWTSAAWTSAA